jgi:hypothetical protein
MSHYSKAIGSLVGAVVGVLVAFNVPVPPEWEQAAQALAVIAGPILGTFFAPKNT